MTTNANPKKDYTPRPYRPALFAVDGETRFPGWCNGRTWNGFAWPLFTRETCELILKAFGGNTGQLLWKFSEDSKSVDVWYPPEVTDDTDPTTFEASTINVDGVEVTGFELGSGYWCWDEYDLDKPKKPVEVYHTMIVGKQEYTIKFESAEQAWRKISAFKELYGDNVTLEISGTLNDGSGDLIYARNWSGGRVKVQKMGRRYVTVLADDEPCKIDMQADNHGIETILVKTNG